MGIIFSATSTTQFWRSTLDGQIVEFFNSGFNGAIPIWAGNLILIIISLLLALLFGGLIGYQREVGGHPAGFRTQILICISSALIMIISAYGIGEDLDRDIMRFAAAGVGGVGFLGAGSIIHNGFNVKGLTTAATIWVTMAIGMCCGMGYFVVSTITEVIALIALIIFRKFEKLFTKGRTKVKIIVSIDEPVTSKILELADKLEVNVKELSSELLKDEHDKKRLVTFIIVNDDPSTTNSFVNELKSSINALDIKISK